MIIFIGDSWGVGEWQVDKNNCGYISGPSVGQYFSLNNRVINLCVGGTSNTLAIDRLEDLLRKFTPDSYDTFYWLVTDPLRCVEAQFYTIEHDIEAFILERLHTAFYRINELGKKYNITINLIGGLCDLDSVSVSEYTNLQMTVPSWGKIISENYPSSVYACVPEVQNIKNLDKESYIKLSNKCLEKRYFMQRTSGFSCEHPDSTSHRLLRDILDPNSKNLY
jgi:hypothetical protein